MREREREREKTPFNPSKAASLVIPYTGSVYNIHFYLMLVGNKGWPGGKIEMMAQSQAPKM
jgi:hypothetical protein